MNTQLKIRMLAVCVAVAVALGAAGTAFAAELTHRWSFNGDWSDSAGGADAVKCGTYVSLYGGRVHMGYGACSHGTGGEKALAKSVSDAFNGIVAKFRARYPEKPIVVSESGCGAAFGRRGEYASPNTEEFQNEYLTDVFETLWGNPDVVGLAIWQMNDGRTRERFGGEAVSAFFGGSTAGVFDRLRRPKLSAETVRKYFNLKP